MVINGICIVIHLMLQSQKPYTVCVISVNISDILCGLYLGIIWISNVLFEGKFILSEVKWRSGSVCFLAFSIVIYFTITSQLVLAKLTLSRLMIVINPLYTRFNNFKQIVGLAIAIYILSFLLTAVITMYLKLSEDILPTNLCLPFIDPTHSIFLVKILVWSVICSQYITSILITVSHIILIRKLKKHQEIIRQIKWSKKSKNSLLLQLLVVTFSNVICWFPANIIYIFTIFVPKYPIQLVVWMTVFVVPLNSIINPIVFISTYFWKNSKYING